MKHLKTFENFGPLVGKDLYAILSNIFVPDSEDANCILELKEEFAEYDLILVNHVIVDGETLNVIVEGDKENILDYCAHGAIDEDDIVFTTEPTFPQQMMESVRHGHFPYFSIDRSTFAVRFDAASNDLAVDAINYNDSKTHFSFCSENWSMTKCQAVASDVVKMLKAGKSDKEIKEFLEPFSY